MYKLGLRAMVTKTPKTEIFVGTKSGAESEKKLSRIFEIFEYLNIENQKITFRSSGFVDVFQGFEP